MSLSRKKHQNVIFFISAGILMSSATALGWTIFAIVQMVFEELL